MLIHTHICNYAPLHMCFTHGIEMPTSNPELVGTSQHFGYPLAMAGDRFFPVVSPTPAVEDSVPAVSGGGGSSAWFAGRIYRLFCDLCMYNIV